MTRTEWFNRGMWATLLICVCAVWFILHCAGCAPQQEPDTIRAADCKAEIDRIRNSSRTCQIAVIRSEELGRLVPSCAAILGDGGLHLTCKDGGAE